jgi:hypothetical protein
MDNYILCDSGIEYTSSSSKAIIVKLIPNQDIYYTIDLYLSSCGNYIIDENQKRCFKLRDEIKFGRYSIGYKKFLQDCLFYNRNKKIDKLVNG